MAPLRRPVAEITVSKSMTMREREIAGKELDQG